MRFRTVSILYLAALAAEVYALATDSASIEYVAKPALMPILILYLAFSTKGVGAVRFTMIAALVFSWFGDVFLMFDKQSGGLFVYGLAAFLTAHILYIYYFLAVRRLNRVETRPSVRALIAIILYSGALFAFIAPHVGQMLVPVAIYSAALTAMLATSLAAFRFGDQDFGKLCVAGTLLFVVSDSILAVNRFAVPFTAGPVLVMLTYGIAQFLICEGAKRNLISNL